MVNSITNQYTSKRYQTWPGSGGEKATWQRWWQQQPRPPKGTFHVPMNYGYFKRFITTYVRSNPFEPPGTPYEPQPWTINEPDWSETTNNSLSALQAQLGDTSGWGENLATAKESIGTVERRALQLVRAANAIRKCNFGSAANILGVAKPRNLKQGAKAFADNFLEYHFGWQPAIADIHSSLKTLTQTDFGGRKLVGKAHQHFTYRGEYDWTHWSADWTITVKCGCNATITNESAYLANQLGVLNPLAVAWELVPFSFVVDWFANVGQVVGSLTGFVGVSIADAYTTSFGDANFQETINQYVDPYWVFTSYGMKNIIVRRVGGLPSPKLVLKSFNGFSPIRGLTAIALLLQALR